jgi:hypothetical protein
MIYVPQHQVKKAKYCQSNSTPLSQTRFYTGQSWLRTVTLVSNNASSMCEPSVVGPDPLLHQSTPLAGNKRSKLFGLQVCSSFDPVGCVSSSNCRGVVSSSCCCCVSRGDYGAPLL